MIPPAERRFCLFRDAKAIIFDLDGTLYSCDKLEHEIKDCAIRYIASLKNMDFPSARSLLECTKEKLTRSKELDATITATCMELGGDIHRLHEHFAAEINPERLLGRDEALAKFLARLSEKFDLYIYTNNNRALSGRIMNSLGISGCFRQVFTIEDSWCPKPDLSALENIFSSIGMSPAECLFVGDRYDVDLRLPASLGSMVYQVCKSQGLVFPLEALLS